MPLLAVLAASPGFAADTGPEYLEADAVSDPISDGFLLLRLPFEEERANTLHLRTFYQDRSYSGDPDRQDWAGGGWLSGVGSFWESRVKLAATLYTSQKLYADDDKADTGALQPVHNSYTQLGEIYASLTLERFAIQAGRYAVELPYINTNDIRMTPQTFQGIQAIYSPNEHWDIGASTLTHIKPRTREGFDSLYEIAGLPENEDIFVAASLYEPEPGTLFGFYALHAPQFHNGAYLEASKRLNLAQNRYVQLSAQYTRQDSTGDEIGGDFSVNHYGLRATWKDGWYSGSLAWTDYPEEDRLRSPWGGIPGYTSVLINDFNRPEETAWLIGGTVDFASLGARGLAINAKAIFGDTPDCGVSSSRDQDEYNLNINYRPPLAKLAGLLLQLRFGWVERSDTCSSDSGPQIADDIAEVRFVTNYAFEF